MRILGSWSKEYLTVYFLYDKNFFLWLPCSESYNNPKRSVLLLPSICRWGRWGRRGYTACPRSHEGEVAEQETDSVITFQNQPPEPYATSYDALPILRIYNLLHSPGCTSDKTALEWSIITKKLANLQYLHNEEIMKPVMFASCVQVSRCCDDYLSKSYLNLSVFRLC